MEKRERQTKFRNYRRMLVDRWERLDWKDGMHDRFETACLECLLESLDSLAAEEENLEEIMQRIQQIQKEMAGGEVL